MDLRRRLTARPFAMPPLLSATLAMALVTSLVFSGCGRARDISATDAEAAQSLHRLPSLAQTQADLTSAIEEIGRAASAAVPDLAWAWRLSPHRVECRPPYHNAGGVELLLPKYIANAPIPDEAWDQVLAAARDAASRLAISETEVFSDAPGHHDVRFHGPTGTAIRMNSQQAAVISGGTGCRLPNP